MSTDALVKPYQDLRSKTLARDRGLREKVMSLEEAAKVVSDGDHVAIGGCTVSRTPMAMIWALIRARRKNLTVSRSITSTEGDLVLDPFIGSGTTGETALQLNRRFVGVEINDRYAQIATKRLRNANRLL